MDPETATYRKLYFEQATWTVKIVSLLWAEIYDIAGKNSVTITKVMDSPEQYLYSGKPCHLLVTGKKRNIESFVTQFREFEAEKSTRLSEKKVNNREIPVI